MARKVAVFTVPTDIRWYFEGGLHYATQGTITMLSAYEV